MVGIEIDRLPETVFRSAAVAGGLADHPHQTISRSSETLLPKMPLAYGDRLSKTSLIGQLRRLTQQQSEAQPQCGTQLLRATGVAGCECARS